MKSFDEIDIDALRHQDHPPMDLCMMAAVKQLLQVPSAQGWNYLPQSRGFLRELGDEVWGLYGDMRGYPEPVTFCGCEIDGRYDHWEDRTFYRVFLPEDCATPETQPLLEVLRAAQAE